jgi:hypothetical protein
MKRLTTVMGRQHRFWWISKEGRGLTGKIEAHGRARRSGQFAMKTLFSHKGTGWTLRPLFPKSVSLRGLFLGQPLLEICEGRVSRHAATGGRAASPAGRFQPPLVFVVVAVHT